jgi:hypothetical protein
MGLLNILVLLLGDVLETLLHVVVDVVMVERLDNVLHVVGLALNKCTEMKHNALSLIPLAKNGRVGVLKGSKLLLVPLPLTLKLLGNLLLEDQGFESIITLLLELEELLLPVLELLNQEVVALGHLGNFSVHTALEVDEILPSFLGVTGVLVALSHNLVQVTHGDLGHQRLLDGPSENSLDATVAALWYSVSTKYIG